MGAADTVKGQARAAFARPRICQPGGIAQPREAPEGFERVSIADCHGSGII